MQKKRKKKNLNVIFIQNFHAIAGRRIQTTNGFQNYTVERMLKQ